MRSARFIVLGALSAIVFNFVTGKVASGRVGVDEKLGQRVPGDLVFRDENGDSVRLGELIDKPTILSLVYYRCPGICSPLLSGVADAVSKIDLIPGKDYQILTVSFDPADTPSLSRRKKANYLKAIGRPFPPEAWHWLVGDSASIAALTDAVGFHYERRGRDFVHPGLITVLAPDGKVVRYLYGITFLPFDLKMALYEASQGRTGPTISKVLLYCFSYDPQGKKYAFNFLKVSGTLVLFFATLLVGYLTILPRFRKKSER